MQSESERDERVMAILVEALQRPPWERHEYVRTASEADEALRQDVAAALEWEQRTAGVSRHSERWRRVEDLHLKARRRRRISLGRFLATACAADDRLRCEVEALLKQDTPEGNELRNTQSGTVTSSRIQAGADPIDVPPGKESVGVQPIGRKLNRCFLWAAAFWSAAVFACYGIGTWIIVRPGAKPKALGWTAVMRNHRWIVNGVDPSGPSANRLHKGDWLLAFNGDPRVETIGPELFIYFLPPGSPYTVRVQRKPFETAITFSLSEQQAVPRLTLSRVLALTQGLICLFLGVFMFLLRPDYRVAQLGFALFLTVSVRLLYLTLEPFNVAGQGGLALLIVSLWWMSENWMNALMYHFTFRFFSNLLKERFWSILTLLLYLTCVVFSVLNCAWAALLLGGFTSATALASQNLALLNVRDYMTSGFRHGFEAGALVFTIATLAFGYRRAQAGDQRRRVRWLAFGSILGLGPLCIGLAFFVLLDLWHGTVAGSQEWSARLSPLNAATTFGPVVWTYAVVKHRILGVEAVIRQGLKYLFARNVLRILLVLPVVGLILPVALHADRPLADAFGRNTLRLNSTLLIALSVSLKYRRQLGDSLDRRFFREEHDKECVLTDLIERIGEIDLLEDVSAVVCEQLAATMHPCSISVCYREAPGSEMRLRYRSGSGLETGPAVSEGFRILRMARETRKPILLDPGGLPACEGEWVQKMGAHLLVPIGLANQPPGGLLVIGEKRSEEPYAPADLTLLQAIAAQMAVVYERFWLRRQVEMDRRLKYEVLAHVDAQSVDLLKECPACGYCYENREQTCPGDGNPLVHALPVPRTIESRYRLDKRIGQGGMGTVFEALDLRLHRKVAVKLLVGKLFGNPAAIRRFEREAEACARLSHPNIIAIHDFGRIGQEGAYIVMDRLQGRTLGSELKRTGTLSPSAAVDWFDQFLNGLQAAHIAGVAHRDLKPGNIFISALEVGDRITILDFGLAKLSLAEAAEPETLTMFGTVIGTMGYMSPEQLSDQPADTRSDLFSTGVIIYEAITGCLPFDATNYTDLLRTISHGPPPILGRSVEVLQLNTL
jgi:hypothetical protein